MDKTILNDSLIKDEKKYKLFVSKSKGRIPVIKVSKSRKQSLKFSFEPKK